MNRAAVAAAALCVVAVPRAAAADPVAVHVHSPSHLLSDQGADLRLPPGYFVDEDAWGRIDAEMRRLQDAETRLTAENVSLRRSASAWAWPGWGPTALAIASGIAVGAYVEHRLH